MSGILLFIVVFVLSWIGTGLIRRYALSRSLLDVPNARSSHVIPTPRGGGVGIVVAFFLGLLGWMLTGNDIPSALGWALAGSGVAIAVLGFLDDHGHIPARWRLLGHFAAAGWATYWLGGLPAMPLFGASIDLGFIGTLFVLLFLVWLLNLYNFMDGIDGIASIEAVSCCLGMLLILTAAGHGAQAAPLLILMAAAVSGFLLWNFPPARIFMGDAGSGFLGIAIGILALQTAWVDAQLFFSWLILLGVFIVDATWTLARRLLRGEKVYEAHRSHAYQYASRRVGWHLPVTLGVLFINAFWLLPWACWVGLYGGSGLVGIIVAYLPLIAVAVWLRAGEQEVVL